MKPGWVTPRALSGALARVIARAPRVRLSLGRWIVAGAALLLLIPNSSVMEHRAVVAVFLFALATGRGRQFLRDWVPLTASAALFVLLRQVAASSPFPRQGAAIASLESALFGGTTPTAALQSALPGPAFAQAGGGVEAWLAYGATAVHASYFFGFVLVGLWLWLRWRAHFALYTRTLAFTFLLGLVGYVLLPAEPPWLLAREPGAPPAGRYIVETTRGAPVASAVVEAGRAWQRDPDALGDPNPAAAMPSVHTAVTTALTLVLWRVDRRAGVAGLVYTAAMCFSLVYLGEHWVLDLLAGMACAGAAMWLASRFPYRGTRFRAAP